MHIKFNNTYLEKLFEALKGDKKGLYSIRVDLKYRLEFSIEKDEIALQEIVMIEDLSNHYR